MLYIECDNDEVLIETLGVKEYVHEGGKFRVCNKLSCLSNVKALIDEDPGKLQPEYLTKAALKDEIHFIKHYVDVNNNNELLVLCPDLENWLVRAIKECKINTKDFNLPDNAKEIHSIGKNKFKRKKLCEMITEMKKKSQMIKTLQKFLK